MTGEHYFTASPQARGAVDRDRRSRWPGGPTACRRRRGLLGRPARPGHRGAAAQGGAARPRGPPGRCSTWAAATVRSPACWPPRRRGPPSTRSTSTRGRCDLTRANADAARAWPTGCVAADPDEVPAEVSFAADLVATRRSGSARRSCTRSCDRWLPRLGPDGTAWLVVAEAPRRRLAARAGCGERGWAVERHASQQGFRVLRVSCPPQQFGRRTGRRDRRIPDSWGTSTSPGWRTRSPTGGCSSPTCRSGSARAPRWRWSGRTAPARPRCCGMVAGDLPVTDGAIARVRRARRDAPVHRHDRRDDARRSTDLGAGAGRAGRPRRAGAARWPTAEAAMHAAEAAGNAAPRPRRPSCAYADALRRLGRGRRVRRRGALRHRQRRPRWTCRGTTARHRPVRHALRRPAEAVRAGAAAARRRTRCCCSTSRTTSSTYRRSAGWRRGCASRTKSVLYVSHDRELLAQTATGWSTVEGGTAWTHPGGFASWHEARAARYERLDELRRRWDEEHQKLKDLVLMYKQKAAYNDGLASRYQAAQTRLRKFEEAGPPPAAPEGAGHPDAPRRRPYRQARGDLRAAGAGEPDLPVRPGDLVRRPGGGARRQRHRQVALPAAAGPGRHRPGRRARAGRRRAADAGRARRRRRGSARGCGPGTSRRPTTGRTWSDEDAGRDPVARRRPPARACPGTTR